ncbi:MAG: NADH-quinone oxidoreductase subunit J [Myxococcota bacterium]
MESLLFVLFAGLAVSTALGVVMLRDPIKGAMCLIGTFFALASLFVLQRAELLGVLEVLVYAGAIMVLFVFVLMLVEDKNAALFSQAISERVTIPLKVGAVVVIAGTLLWVVVSAAFPSPASLPADFGQAAAVGRVFFSNFLFHFEMSSLLLLAAIVGAVVISRRARLSGD